jgi:pyruvate dehydrogenase E1 component beta subunit
MATRKLYEAMRDAFDEEMQRDERVCLFGEDVGQFGGVFGTSVGLQEKYGRRRVFDTPLSEAAILGAAVGAAASGLRPIAEIMYLDFITTGMDPLINQAPKLRYMSGGQLMLPLVVFTQCGAGTSEAAQHSQCLEAWLAHTPGLKVVMPATVCDAKGLLKASIRDNNPVVYIWHKMLYDSEEEVPDGDKVVPLGEAVVRRQGTDLTLVATSLMVHRALAAAEALDGEISVELIDPRTVMPLDIETILASVEKTGRLLVVHEASSQGGIGAEIVRQVVEKAFDRLAGPPVVLGGAHLPMPFTRVLERVCVPQEEDIVAAVRRVAQAGRRKAEGGRRKRESSVR